MACRGSAVRIRLAPLGFQLVALPGSCEIWCKKAQISVLSCIQFSVVAACLGHFCEQLFVMVHNVLATDHRSEVHLNAVLSAPRSEMFKNLCVTFGFK